MGQYRCCDQAYVTISKTVVKSGNIDVNQPTGKINADNYWLSPCTFTRNVDVYGKSKLKNMNGLSMKWFKSENGPCVVIKIWMNTPIQRSLAVLVASDRTCCNTLWLELTSVTGIIAQGGGGGRKRVRVRGREGESGWVEIVVTLYGPAPSRERTFPTSTSGTAVSRSPDWLTNCAHWRLVQVGTLWNKL